jgi:SAM-dependent methyltransferase
MKTDYWNRVAPTKIFSHPVNTAKLSEFVPPTSRILDYGCGYGRALGILESYGYNDLIGVDPVSAMIERAQREFPSVSFAVLGTNQRTDLPDASVDAVLLFAVLTSAPANDTQQMIIAEITRLLRPGGVLYISDMFLQADARNLQRYVEGEKRHGVYGVFDLRDGVTVRHHDRSWIATLTTGYEQLAVEEIPIETMNGNPATAFQWFGRKPSV